MPTFVIMFLGNGWACGTVIWNGIELILGWRAEALEVEAPIQKGYKGLQKVTFFWEFQVGGQLGMWTKGL